MSQVAHSPGFGYGDNNETDVPSERSPALHSLVVPSFELSGLEGATPVVARRHRNMYGEKIVEFAESGRPVMYRRRTHYGHNTPDRNTCITKTHSDSRLQESGPTIHTGTKDFENLYLDKSNISSEGPVMFENLRFYEPMFEYPRSFETNISPERPVMYRSWINYDDNSPDLNTNITKAHSDPRAEESGFTIYSGTEHFKNHRVSDRSISILDEKGRVLDLPNQERHQAIRDARVVGVGDWLLHNQSFYTWRTSRSRREKPVLFCYGHPGAGKTSIRCEPPQPPNILPC